MRVSPLEISLDQDLRKLFHNAYENIKPADEARGKILHQAKLLLPKIQEPPEGLALRPRRWHG